MVLRRNRPTAGNSLTPRANQAAARDAAQNDVFLREVDDALREEQMLRALRRWGIVAGAVIVLALAALAGWLGWNAHRAHVAETNAEQFTIAMDRLDAGDPANASAQLGPIATGGNDGSAIAARLLQAGIAAKQGRTAQAIGTYATIAADTSAPQPFRDLATVREIALRFDTMPVDQVVTRLRPLAAPGNPWFGSAGEMLGMAYIKQGRKDLAAPLFGQIAKDKDVPDSLKARARQIAGLLGYDAVEDITVAPAAPTGPAPAGAPAPSPAAAQ